MTGLFIASRTAGLALERNGEAVIIDEVEGLAALAFDPSSSTLYGVTSGEAYAWRVAGGGLAERPSVSRLGSIETGGANGCHLAVADGRLVVANYDSGTISSIRLSADGGFSGGVVMLGWLGAGPERDRQEQAHPHQILAGVAVPGSPGAPGGVLVVDLGGDALVSVSGADLDAAESHGSASVQLDPPNAISVPAGSGPRHAVVLDDGTLVISGELSSEFLVLTHEGTWRLVPSTARATSPGVRNYPSDIALHNSGTVIVANRGNDTVAFLTANGEVIEIDAGGRWPQSLELVGEELLIACENDDLVTAVRLDPHTGLPVGDARNKAECPSPSWLLSV